jgi:hypothetical protein
MREINDRYEVQTVGGKFVIRDLWMRAFCSLDGENVLRWSTWTDAEGWLQRCYRIWGHVPNVGDDPNDLNAKARNWAEMRSRNARRSPWEGWSVPLWDSRFGQ